VKVPL